MTTEQSLVLCSSSERNGLLLSNLSWSRRSLVFTSTFQCTTCEFDHLFPVFDHTVATHLFKNLNEAMILPSSALGPSKAFLVLNLELWAALLFTVMHFLYLSSERICSFYVNIMVYQRLDYIIKYCVVVLNYLLLLYKL